MSDGPHPEAQAVLDVLEQVGLPDYSTVGVEELRLMNVALAPKEPTEPVHHVTDRTIPGPAGDLPVRVYRPGDAGPYPTVVYLHGGGFVMGNLDTHDPVCRALANDAEAVVVSVDYRLAPKHPFPAAVEDAYAAVEWATSRAHEESGHPDRVAVVGDSAGGTLSAVACLLARHRDGPDLAHQGLVYPATAFADSFPSHEENAEGYFLTMEAMEWFAGHYLESELDGYNPVAFPLSARDLSGLPPATVVTAGFDPLRDEGIAYADRLEAADVPVTHRHYDGMIHGFASMLAEPAAIERGREAIAALAGDLRDSFASGGTGRR